MVPRLRYLAVHQCVAPFMHTCADTALCVASTPFGRAVVPLVYKIEAPSSSATVGSALDSHLDSLLVLGVAEATKGDCEVHTRKCIHTNIHAYMHANRDTHIHTYIHTYMDSHYLKKSAAFGLLLGAQGAQAPPAEQQADHSVTILFCLIGVVGRAAARHTGPASRC
jgi:hypothetical protein